MENNFTSTEHLRDANGNAVMESAGRTIAKMREKQKGRNFIYGVVITALAMTTAITGVALGTSTRYARDLRAKLNTANSQMAQMSQKYSANANGTGGTAGTTGTSNYSTGINGTDGTTGTTNNYGTGTGSAAGRNWGAMRNWRNFNNTNSGIAPARLPANMDGTAASTGMYTNYAGTGSNTSGTGTAANYGTTYNGANYSRTANTAGTASSNTAM